MIDTDKYEGCIADMKGYDLAILAEELLAEVERLRQVMIYVEQRQPHPALEMALKQGLYLSEIRERIE